MLHDLELNPCVSSPCGADSSCVIVSKPIRNYACICESGYWNGQTCINSKSDYSIYYNNLSVLPN